MTQKPPFIIGLTGSVGMGKSTTARMFADEGVAVWDADAAVHRLYAQGGAAVEPIGKLRKGLVVDGAVSRAALKTWIGTDDTALGQIEAVVHPLVAADRRAFVKTATADIVLWDIPLLFETGADAEVDLTVVVSAPPEVQRQRVMSRPGMTDEQFQTILANQIPDAEKRARADVVIETITLEDARKSVRQVLRDVKKKMGYA